MTQITSLIFIIIGWIVVHFLARHRDLERDWRAFAIETVKNINIIEEDAIRYHTSDTRNRDSEQKIKQSLSELDTRLNALKKFFRFNEDISFFRAAITLDNFASSGFKKQDYPSVILNDISYHAGLLRECLYNIPNRSYLQFLQDLRNSKR